MIKKEETPKNLEKPRKTPKKCKTLNCRSYAIDETGFCNICHPENRKKAKEIGKLGGRPRKIKKLELNKLKKTTPQNANDILSKIGDMWLYTEAGEITTKQGEVILKGCEIALQALEQKILEDRISLKNVKRAI